MTKQITKESSVIKKHMISCLKWLWYLLAMLVVAFSILWTTTRIYTPELMKHQALLEQWASQLLHHPVHIGKISAQWQGLGPSIQFDDVDMLTDSKKHVLLDINHFSVKINVLKSLLFWQLHASKLTIDGAQFAIWQHQDGSYGLQGEAKRNHDQAFFGWLSIPNVVKFLFANGHIVLQHIKVTWHGAEKQLVPVNNLELELINHGDSHRLLGNAQLEHTQAKLTWILNLNGDAADMHDWQGEGYVNAANLALGPWLHGIHFNDIDASKALTSFTVWLHIAKGHINKAESKITLQHVALSFDKGKVKQKINNVSGQFFWQGKNWHAWHLLGKQLHLHLSEKLGKDRSVVNSFIGRLEATPNSGKLTLDNNPLTIWMPQIFPAKLSLQAASGEFTWLRTNKSWQFHLNDFRIYNSEAKLAANATLILPNDGSSPFINIIANSDLYKLRYILHYLPKKLLASKVVKWLDSALVSSEDAHTQINIRGQVRDIPFAENNKKPNEHLWVTTVFHNLDLRYSQHYPMAKNIDGILRFIGNKMMVNIDKGSVCGAHINTLQAEIPDITSNQKIPVMMSVLGDISGDFTNFENFLMQSPMRDVVKKLHDNKIQLKGVAQTKIKMLIPITHDNKKTKLLGEIATTNGMVIATKQHITIHDVRGTAKFNERDLWANDFSAVLFDEPIKFSLSTVNEKSKAHFSLHANGKINIARLKQVVASPFLDKLHGTTDYQLELKLYKNPHKIEIFNLHSSLQGITSNLPQPFAKAATQEKPLDLMILFSDDNPMLVKLSYAHWLKAILEYQDIKQHENFMRGTIILHKGKLQLAKSTGLRIIGSLPDFDLQPWQNLMKAMPKESAAMQKETTASALGKIINSIDLQVGTLKAYQQTLHKVSLHIRPVKYSWQTKIKSDNIAGIIILPNPGLSQPIDIDLTHCNLHLTKSKGKELNPDILPNMDLAINRFKLNDKQVGSVLLLLRHKQHSAVIKRLVIQTNQYKLKLTGSWSELNQQEQTMLTGELQANNFGNLLRHWNISKKLVNGYGQALFKLSWRGTPYEPDMQSLDGRLSVQIRRGRIVGLSKETNEKLGMGKFINLLSLQTLPRRLTLDFSDLTDSGFAFDLLRGSIKLHDGNAVTKDTRVDGSVAKIRLQGRIGLANKDYNLKMKVVPYLTSSLPVIATLIGGPIAGAVTWAADKLFSPELQRYTAHYYTIEGPWKKPIFHELQNTA